MPCSKRRSTPIRMVTHATEIGFTLAFKLVLTRYNDGCNRGRVLAGVIRKPRRKDDLQVGLLLRRYSEEPNCLSRTVKGFDESQAETIAKSLSVVHIQG